MPRAGTPIAHSSKASRPVVAILLGAAVLGFLGGGLTSVGQSLLSGGWHSLVNSAAPWVMVAFLAGLPARPRWGIAAVAGALTQVGLVAGYYAVAMARGYPPGNGALVWGATGLVAGPVFAAAGALVRDHRSWLRAAAAGVTGAVWLRDGMSFLSLATSDPRTTSGPGTAAGWSYIAVGALLPLILARSFTDRCRAVLFLVVGTGAVWAATELVEIALRS